MWKEILIDDLNGLQEYSSAFNAMDCSVEYGYNYSADLIRRILIKKEESHCYLYKSADRIILRMYKYNKSIDRMEVFHTLDSMQVEEIAKRKDETWDIYREFIKIVGERHGKIVRTCKLSDVVVNTFLGTRETYTKEVILKYKEWGITVYELENHWDFEV